VDDLNALSLAPGREMPARQLRPVVGDSHHPRRNPPAPSPPSPTSHSTRTTENSLPCLPASHNFSLFFASLSPSSQTTFPPPQQNFPRKPRPRPL
jgi:hypothetical protein